jgi:catechol 2,3-dioxygenase-like lactoylglutathione lyase family enzyme
MNRPNSTEGLRHVALYVHDLEACEHFYVEHLGMLVEWRPDQDNIYLTSGNDNLAIHRVTSDFDLSHHQKLDHIGFIIKTPEQVDEWYDYLSEQGIKIRQPPRTHRDGARSFYCYDPASTVIQLIYHPPIS